MQGRPTAEQCRQDSGTAGLVALGWRDCPSAFLEAALGQSPACCWSFQLAPGRHLGGKIGCQLDTQHSFASNVLPGEMEMTPGSSHEGDLDQRPLVCCGECLPSHRRDCGDLFPFHRRDCSQLVSGDRSCGQHI